MFVEAWAQANGYNMTVNNITPWRREHMTNMVNAFDFTSPVDLSLPKLTDVRDPEPLDHDNWSGDLSLGSLSGPWVGASKCQNGYAHGNYPKIPYGKENLAQNMDALVEDGFKQLRGAITEGRYITIEAAASGLGLTRTKKGKVIAASGDGAHKDILQRWVLHTADDNRFGKAFYLQSAALEKGFIAPNGRLTKDRKDAQVFLFEYSAAGTAFTLQVQGANGGKYVSFGEKRKLSEKCRAVADINWKGEGDRFSIFGVNYKN